MKLQLEFERPDLEEMITEYFAKRGFEVKNLDELCELFNTAFADGVKVEAAIAPVPPPAKVMRQSPTVSTWDESATRAPAESKQVRMSKEDLMDPTGPRTAPSRDELLAQSRRELEHVLQQSKDLEKQGN